ASPSVYRVRMPPRAQQRILAAAARAACHARWDPAADRVVPAAPARAADRVTELLDTAIRLFAARGYQAVSLDDIGAELGLAGPRPRRPRRRPRRGADRALARPPGPGGRPAFARHGRSVRIARKARPVTDHQYLLTAVEDGVGIVQLNHPEKRNALGWELHTQ